MSPVAKLLGAAILCGPFFAGMLTGQKYQKWSICFDRASYLLLFVAIVPIMLLSIIDQYANDTQVNTVWVLFLVLSATMSALFLAGSAVAFSIMAIARRLSCR
ncbi:hypothetical protein KW797_03305 [Candidatus Parcubacteria bacterium]|nr:hypothetical protein [Candidatus Parcubacteria bacterium]